MRVLELSLRNYRVFEELELELPAQVIGVFGENGSGKSTLMESVAFACYGVEAVRTKKHEIRTHGVLTDCEVRLAFEHAGQQFEIRRRIKGKGHTPEAELYGGGLLLASGATEVDSEVGRILHMDLHVFRASVYAEQKQLDAFSDVTTGKRKEMALRLLGIKPVDDARNAARREARATTLNATQLEGAVPDMAALEAELKEARGVMAEAKGLAKDAKGELKTAIDGAKAASKAFQELDVARQRIERLTELLASKTQQRDDRQAELDELVGRHERLAEELQALPELEEERIELRDADDRLRTGIRLLELASTLEAVETQVAAFPAVDVEDAIASLGRTRVAHAQAHTAAAAGQAELRHRATLLEEVQARLARATEADPTEPCPTCGRPLGEDFVGYVKHCKAEVVKAQKAVSAAATSDKQAGSALARLSKALDSFTSAAEAAQRATERRSQLAEQVDALRADLVPLAEPFDGAVPDLDELRTRSDRAGVVGTRIAELGAQQKFAAQLEKDLAAADRRLVALESELAKLGEQAREVSFDPDAYTRAAAEVHRSEDALEAARDLERSAGDALKDAEKAIGEFTVALELAKETAAKVDELRSDARYVERVAMLLDGFRDHLVARVGPELSREAEALFRELTNHEYDDLRVDEENLAIQIADGDTYFPIDRFSGSESDLANLALRVAISTHLSRVSGADVGLMVLDEVLGSLDEERKDLMVRTLGTLSARFHQLFVITHAERVKDQFPASILVRKDGRRRSSAVLV